MAILNATTMERNRVNLGWSVPAKVPADLRNCTGKTQEHLALLPEQIRHCFSTAPVPADGVNKESDHRNRRLLRACRERPRSSCAAECEYEFSPSEVDCHATLPRGVMSHATEGTISL